MSHSLFQLIHFFNQLLISFTYLTFIFYIRKSFLIQFGSLFLRSFIWLIEWLIYFYYFIFSYLTVFFISFHFQLIYLFILIFYSHLTGLTRQQYIGLMALLDSFDRLKLSSKYRKYRPLVHKVAGNAKKWWVGYELRPVDNVSKVFGDFLLVL